MARPRVTLKTAHELVAAGLISSDCEEEIAGVAARYAVAVTPAMAELMDAADPGDPIARQFVPDVRELETHPAECHDPIGDHRKSPVKGLVHRYRDRVLLKVASVCPVYCRFCFRREMVGPGASETLSQDEFKAALDYIGVHPEIWEVILTGGDPFVLSPRRLGEITEALSRIAHVRVLRWHTRVPVVAPERVTPDLVQALRSVSKSVFVALHANHPRELTAAARRAIASLIDAGVPVVSQTVLLRGVNDDADTLDALMRAFVEARVKPYYLHHGDLAPGTSSLPHNDLQTGQAIMAELRRRLSGLAMPTYVLDSPSAHGKVPVGASAIRPTGTAGLYEIEAPDGSIHAYEDCCTPADRI